MHMQAFYLFLRYQTLNRRRPADNHPEPTNERDEIDNAMRNLDLMQKRELIQFVERHLSESADDASLAGVFEDGHTYRVWRASNSPRQLLGLILEVAKSQV